MQKQPGRRTRRRKLLSLSPAERMRRMRERRRIEGLKAVVRWVPRKRAVQLPPLDLRLLEARSLAVHVAAALKIDRDPALLDLARQTVERWRERGVQLRQASPSMAVPTPYERRKIYDAFRVVKRRLDAAGRT